MKRQSLAGSALVGLALAIPRITTPLAVSPERTGDNLIFYLIGGNQARNVDCHQQSVALAASGS